MDRKQAIIVRRHGSSNFEFLGGPENPGEAYNKFMSFRLAGGKHAEFAEAILCELSIERHERLEAAPTEDQPKSEPIRNTMKKLKNIVSLIAFAALAFFTLPANAQSYNLGYIGGSTANSPASTDNTTWYTTNSAVIAVTKASNVALQVEHKLNGAGTSAIIFRFAASADGTTWTDSYLLVTNTAAGTTLVSSTRDVSVGAIGFLRLTSINNANANAVTNLFVRYAFKTP
jgi:hypothetical protein